MPVYHIELDVLAMRQRRCKRNCAGEATPGERDRLCARGGRKQRIISGRLGTCVRYTDSDIEAGYTFAHGIEVVMITVAKRNPGYKFIARERVPKCSVTIEVLNPW